MDCSVDSGRMLNVPPAVEGGPQQPLPASVFPTSDVDQAQFEADKRAVYKHPLFPLLALLFERCELATQSSEVQSSESFNLDIQAFVQHQERDRKPFLANEPEIDGLMIKAIQVLRIHLLELEKVQELCKDFCNRYITCLKGKMQSENLLRSDYTQGPGVMSTIENNNNMVSHGNSESGSDSNSPVQYTISPTQQQTGIAHPGASDCLEQRGMLADAVAPRSESVGLLQQQQQQPVLSSTAPPAVYQNSQHSIPPQYDPHIVHGSTPLGQIGVGICQVHNDSAALSGQLSPAPTTPGGSADDCDSDFTSRTGGKKQKRGVLPKQATGVMRSWLFQHLVHPYPTEDEKRHIAAQTNLTLLQVNNWFINARRRILQPMLESSTPADSVQNALSMHKGQRKKSHNSSRRFWPQDIASLQPQLNNGELTSSDEDCDSYSSDGEESNLIIDSSAVQHSDGTHNGHPMDGGTPFSNGSESDHH